MGKLMNSAGLQRVKRFHLPQTGRGKGGWSDRSCMPLRQSQELGKNGELPRHPQDSGKACELPRRPQELGKSCELPRRPQELGKSCELPRHPKVLGESGGRPRQPPHLCRVSKLRLQKSVPGLDPQSVTVSELNCQNRVLDRVLGLAP